MHGRIRCYGAAPFRVEGRLTLRAVGAGITAARSGMNLG